MDVPPDTPVASPVTESIVATVVLPLIQVPVPVISPNSVAEPEHMLNVPVIAAGNGLTEIVVIALQPAGKA